MLIENIEVYGFRAALRGMRNPMESWDRSDSRYYSGRASKDALTQLPWDETRVLALEYPFIGEADMTRACALIAAGGAERKFIRMIAIYWDIVISRAGWQELDTYKISTVRDSCSTMHKLGHRNLTVADFEDQDVSLVTLGELNAMGHSYRSYLNLKKYPTPEVEAASVFTDPATGKTYAGVELLRHMKYRLPEGFLQRATYSFNYEVALKMWYDRHNHRMPEWSGSDGICATLRKLPYFDQFLEAMQSRHQRG